MTEHLTAYLAHLVAEFRDTATECAALPDGVVFDSTRAQHQARMATLRQVGDDLAALLVVDRPGWDVVLDQVRQGVR